MPASPGSHAKFLQNLRASREAVLDVACWIRCLGNRTVEVLASTEAPAHSAWKDHVDKGDLRVTNTSRGTTSIVNVKKRGVRFGDSPDKFPYDTVMVCAKHSFDAHPVDAFVYLDKAKEHIGILPGASSAEWEVVKKHDGRYGPGYTQLFYVCKRELVTFYRFLFP